MRLVTFCAVLLAVLGCLAIPSSGVAKGIALGDLPPDGELDRLGFEKGDVIHQVGGNDVETTEELTAWAQTAKDSGAQWLTFTIERQGACWFLNSSYNGQRAYQYGPLKTAPASACGMAEPPAQTVTPASVRLPSVGLILQSGRFGTKGVPVLDVEPGSLARSADIAKGDRITHVNDTLVVDSDTAKLGFEAAASIGSAMVQVDRRGLALYRTINFSRSAPPSSVAATPAPAPSDATTSAASGSTRLAVPSIGIELVTLPSKFGGVTVGKVVEGSLGENALLLAGDRIMQVGGAPVSTATDAAREIQRIVQGTDSSLRLSLAGEGNSLRHVDIPLGKASAPSRSTTILTLVMSGILALVLLAFAVARRKGWGRGFTFRPAMAAPAGFARPMPEAQIPEEEEQEIALARQAVETAERGPIQGPAPSETGGPSWFQQQRERREVERAKRSMEEAERAAARGQAPQGHYPYPPPPYGYYQQRTPFSEKLRVAYWGLKIALVLVVAVWAWSVTGTVVSMLGAIVPAPLRAVTVDLLAKAQDAISKADQGEP